MSRALGPGLQITPVLPTGQQLDAWRLIGVGGGCKITLQGFFRGFVPGLELGADLTNLGTWDLAGLGFLEQV
jgi:hypothetical protein